MTSEQSVPVQPDLAPPERSMEALKNVHVLVVEDDEGTREALTEMLRLAGADVRGVESAAKAMETFEAFRPQLLLCDIAMPEEDGYTLLRRIRALGVERGGDVPAIALTALASEEDRKRALEAGFQRHVAKPVDVDRLVATLAELLRQREAHRDAETRPALQG